mmetsp:Transcript_52836/g.155661  ORF Transcript_52836/g.155661 Transcript_52836/m.155661 type:complete len:208 (-) Transcript_52836:247-870(-)
MNSLYWMSPSLLMSAASSSAFTLSSFQSTGSSLCSMAESSLREITPSLSVSNLAKEAAISASRPLSSITSPFLPFLGPAGAVARVPARCLAALVSMTHSTNSLYWIRPSPLMSAASSRSDTFSSDQPPGSSDWSTIASSPREITPSLFASNFWKAPAIFSTSAFGLGLLTERSSDDQEERSLGSVLSYSLASCAAAVVPITHPTNSS